MGGALPKETLNALYRHDAAVFSVLALMALTSGPALANPGWLWPRPADPGVTQKAAPTPAPSVVAATVSNPTGQQSFGRVDCPSGSTRTGGGVFGSLPFIPAGQQAVNASYPLNQLGWGAWMNNDSWRRRYLHGLRCVPDSVAKQTVFSLADERI